MTENEPMLPDADLLRRIEESHAAHPEDRCDLFRTKFGRCTCKDEQD